MKMLTNFSKTRLSQILIENSSVSLMYLKPLNFNLKKKNFMSLLLQSIHICRGFPLKLLCNLGRGKGKGIVMFY